MKKDNHIATFKQYVIPIKNSLGLISDAEIVTVLNAVLSRKKKQCELNFMFSENFLDKIQ